MKSIQVALSEPGRTLIVNAQVNDSDEGDFLSKPRDLGVVVIGPDSERFKYPAERVIGTGDIGFPGQDPAVSVYRSVVMYATHYTWKLPED